jgi:hypothetical protein
VDPVADPLLFFLVVPGIEPGIILQSIILNSFLTPPMYTISPLNYSVT